MRLPSRNSPRTGLAARVSRGRRHRFAAPLVLLLGLIVTGGMYAALSPASAHTSTAADPSQVAQGRALFQVGCSSCHGQNAEGIQTVRGNQYGPPLIGVGAAAVDFQVGTGRMPLAQPAQQALAKPPVYDKNEIAALAAYVASLGPGPEIPTKDLYDTSGASNSSVVRGGEFFRTNCTACHNFAGAGGALPRGKFAPKLTGVSSKHIYEALLTGPQQMPVFGNGVLSPTDKRDIIAYLKKTESTPAYGGFTIGSLGPVSEGLFAWLAGLGTLTGAAVWIASSTARSKKKAA